MEEEKQQLAKYGQYMRKTDRGTHIIRVKEGDRGQRMGGQLRFADTVEVQCIKRKPLWYSFDIEKEEAVDDVMTQAEIAKFMRNKQKEDLDRISEYDPSKPILPYVPKPRGTINPITEEELEAIKAAGMKGQRRSEGLISKPVHVPKVDEHGHKIYPKEVAPKKAESLMAQYHPTVGVEEYQDIGYQFAPTIGAELVHQVMVYDPATGQITIQNISPEMMMGMYANPADPDQVAGTSYYYG